MELKRIELPFKIKFPILAMGAHLKNTLCFAEDNFAYISPMHPDLNSPGDFLNFQKHLKYFLKQRPKIIACDLHPEYQSTKYVFSSFPLSPFPFHPSFSPFPLSPSTFHLPPSPFPLPPFTLHLIQHHHAHIASCMAENGLKNQAVIGIAFDGTGLGSDNTLWGAEFLLCDYNGFRRLAHLKGIPLLGGERAILEPYRLALAWLYAIYKDKCPDIAFMKKIDKNKRRVLKNMYLSGFNSPPASSMGRLFDAAASIVLEKYKAGAEAELAIQLERIAIGYKPQSQRAGRPPVISYKFKILKQKGGYILDPSPLFREIVSGLRHKEPKEKIAYRFHLTIAEMVKRVSLILRKEHRVKTVALSGGVFQNNLLLGSTLDLLSQEGFKVFTHQKLSCNDSAVSLGQAAAANFRG